MLSAYFGLRGSLPSPAATMPGLFPGDTCLPDPRLGTGVQKKIGKFNTKKLEPSIKMREIYRNLDDRE